jgi:hypothetical protein
VELALRMRAVAQFPPSMAMTCAMSK